MKTGVPFTAGVISAFRAMEVKETPPWFLDPYAEWFCSPEHWKSAENLIRIRQATHHVIRLRTLFFDSQVCLLPQNRTVQVLNLGCGFDTRAIRFPRSNLHYFEIDHEEIIRVKREVLRQRGAGGNSKLSSANYVVDDFFKTLQGMSFNSNVPTLVIWEGNFHYIPMVQIKALFQRLRESIQTLRICFDFISKAFADGGDEDSSRRETFEAFKEMGATWVSGCDDLDGFAKTVGFHVIKKFSAEQLLGHFGKKSPVDPANFRSSFVAVLGYGNDGEFQ